MSRLCATLRFFAVFATWHETYSGEAVVSREGAKAQRIAKRNGDTSMSNKRSTTINDGSRLFA